MFLLLMFTTTDCNCRNLTILRTFPFPLSKPIVLSLKYFQDLWMDYWLFFTSDWQSKTESVNETRGKGGFPLGVWKRLFFTDGWCVVYIVKGCQSFKNQKNGWSPLWTPQVAALTSSSTCSEWKVNEGVAKPSLRHCGIITSKNGGLLLLGIFCSRFHPILLPLKLILEVP